jgi:hypothetical protein
VFRKFCIGRGRAFKAEAMDAYFFCAIRDKKVVIVKTDQWVQQVLAWIWECQSDGLTESNRF